MPPQLQFLGPGVFFLPGAVNSVVVEGPGGRALLVDTGLDDTHARKLLRAVEGAGLTPGAILNTHSHADHHGGNTFLLGRFPDLPVYAPPLEAAIIRHPVLEPLSLWGAAPPAELRTKFLLAPASPAQGVGPGVQALGSIEVELLPVPGHAAEMYAVRVDEVLYAADALFGPEALGKHPLTFGADSAQQKASAAALGEVEGVRVVLPGHGDPTPNLAGLVSANLAAYARTTDAVTAALAQGPATVDELLVRVGAALGMTATNPGAWVLNRAVISAHLTELLAVGAATLTLEGGVLRARA
ncbi:glyoxylase-like metal-dependent hydrolase (beta-lactamase superfamily II) [Deinococcus sp. HSC-46F16]|uniref:MBL fold metallo-hydrolase n=1 Tax=Deinococcus sp. HSC-46F16 TaxID=2910968 RepID=UPI00209FE6DE|nr:MBL fold metallo-hydrolase [Deinococcus sp. HSC-46F16]MCP2015470.1 glyoxylase-like metal-dependent hydrolase (beta-lactamase superfamily II) [Deinococcus sp. HSC-46F16]